MKRGIVANSKLEDDAKTLLFDLLYQVCKDTAGISHSVINL